MRIAYVVQRYGSSIHGGAETACRLFAERLSARGVDVDVYTTCASDYATWANELPEGESVEDGVRVRRFPVVRERTSEFDVLSNRILPDPSATDRETQEEWMRLQGPESPALIDALKEEGSGYDVIGFITYLYYLTYFGLPQVADRAVLHPMAHDEPPLYLPIYDEVFRSPRGLVFLTEEEWDLVRRRFGVADVPAVITGIGIDPPSTVDPAGVRSRFGLEDPYVLYLGRLDESKGCKFLCEWFAAYKERRGGNHKLVLAGQQVYAPPEHPDISYVGAVTGDDKWGLLAGADLLLLPSFFESFAMVLPEAWSMGTPVLVNGFCEVAVGHARRAAGGTWFRSYGEFEAALDRLLNDPETLSALGEAGRRYATDRYTWDSVIDSYLGFLRDL